MAMLQAILHRFCTFCFCERRFAMAPVSSSPVQSTGSPARLYYKLHVGASKRILHLIEALMACTGLAAQGLHGLAAQRLHGLAAQRLFTRYTSTADGLLDLSPAQLRAATKTYKIQLCHLSLHTSPFLLNSVSVDAALPGLLL